MAHRAGLISPYVLAGDAPLPHDLSMAFAAATDTAMRPSDAEPDGTFSATERHESEMRKHGTVFNESKNIDDDSCATCVGIGLVNGQEWWPPGARLLSLFEAVLELARGRVPSPGAIAAYLGVTQWFCFLRRPRL